MKRIEEIASTIDVLKDNNAALIKAAKTSLGSKVLSATGIFSVRWVSIAVKKLKYERFVEADLGHLYQ